MGAAGVAVFITCFIPFFLMFWNKARVKGKVYCFFARKDKSLKGQLCMLRSSFIIFEDRAYDLYPDFIRVARFPMGWPSFLQELVPTGLWDEEDAVQKDWITLETPKEGSLRLRAALDENWIRKLVAEAAAEGGGLRINWKKILPIGLMLIGVIGLIVVLVMKSHGGRL